MAGCSSQLNALGQRYSKALSGTTTVYLYDDAGRLIAETSDAGTTYTEYVWLNDTPVAVIKPGSAALYYIHTDHLDTPRLIEDQSQQIVWRWDNEEPFGASAANDNPSSLGAFAFNLRFPGQYYDAETNNHYNYFRDYSPDTGRYIESDPIGLEGGLNTYSYVNGKPLFYRDPYGLFDPTGFSETATAVATTVGATATAVAGGIILAVWPSSIAEDPPICPDNKKCPPCEPYPVGTIGFQGPEVGKRGRDAGIPHYWFYQVEQIPSTCQCIWKERTKALVGAHHYYNQPNPAMSVNLNGSSRPPAYPH